MEHSFLSRSHHSILVANSQNLILFRICSIFQPMEQALPCPSDGWHACSRRCQLALDLTARGTGFTHPPLHSPEDCNVVGGFVSLCFSNLLLSWKNLSSVFATIHLVLADRRATARTTTFVEPCSIHTKKTSRHIIASNRLSYLFSILHFRFSLTPKAVQINQNQKYIVLGSAYHHDPCFKQLL